MVDELDEIDILALDEVLVLDNDIIDEAEIFSDDEVDDMLQPDVLDVVEAD